MASKLGLKSQYTMNSGYEIPVLGYGVYQTPARDAKAVVLHALKTGYRHVDSAVAYRNEEPCGEAILASGLPRESIFFTSKIPPRGMSYAAASKHVDETLAKTGLKYVDLYLLHSPYGGKGGRLGAWQALADAVAAGKVRSIGVSNYGVHHLEELETYIKETDSKDGKGKAGTVSVNQIELHPWLGRKDIVDFCKDRGILLEAYSPLVQATKLKDPLLLPLAKKHNKTTSQILLRWSLQKGFVPLPKSVTPSRIEENAALYEFELSEDDMKSLDTGRYEPCCWDPTVSRD